MAQISLCPLPDFCMTGIEQPPRIMWIGKRTVEVEVSMTAPSLFRSFDPLS